MASSNLYRLMRAVLRGDTESQIAALTQSIIVEEGRQQCTACRDWTANPILDGGAIYCIFCTSVGPTEASGVEPAAAPIEPDTPNTGADPACVGGGRHSPEPMGP